MEMDIDFALAVRTAMEDAAKLTRKLGHTHVDTGHLLVGLARQAPEMFGHLGDVGALEWTVMRLGPPEGARSDPGELPIKSTLVRALQRAVTDARATDAQQVRPEHLVRAFLDDEASLAARTLGEFGIDSWADWPTN